MLQGGGGALWDIIPQYKYVQYCFFDSLLLKLIISIRQSARVTVVDNARECTGFRVWLRRYRPTSSLPLHACSKLNIRVICTDFTQNFVWYYYFIPTYYFPNMIDKQQQNNKNNNNIHLKIITTFCRVKDSLTVYCCVYVVCSRRIWSHVLPPNFHRSL